MVDAGSVSRAARNDPPRAASQEVQRDVGVGRPLSQVGQVRSESTGPRSPLVRHDSPPERSSAVRVEEPGTGCRRGGSGGLHLGLESGRLPGLRATLRTAPARPALKPASIGTQGVPPSSKRPSSVGKRFFPAPSSGPGSDVIAGRPLRRAAENRTPAGACGNPRRGQRSDRPRWPARSTRRNS